MIRWFFNLLYGAVPAEFPSPFGLEESVQRLADATRRPGFAPIRKERVLGTVTESHVSLELVIPMKGNTSKPFFRGRFVCENGQVRLKGEFTRSVLSKVFDSVWFGILALVVVISPFSLEGDDPAMWLFPLIVIGMFLSGIVFLWGSKWLARNDPARISDVIRSALSEDATADNLDQANFSHDNRRAAREY